MVEQEELISQPDQQRRHNVPVDNDKAAVRYSGLWSEEKYLLNKEKLSKWLKDNRFTVSGEPVWARYNAPFTPWFMRRNEILIPVTDS